MTPHTLVIRLVTVGLIGFLGACAGGTQPGPQARAAPAVTAPEDETFEADRAAILAMAGTYDVTFDFTETVALAPGYSLKPPKLSGAHEVVRVIEDTGRKISLQHILVVGGDEKFPVKHWRQDWIYEPAEVLTFIGGNAWEMRPVSASERQGRWSQTVYQVDDSPRYGAVARWSHDDGVSQWTPDAAWRPLPRRDMTTRDDYHAVKAINRHAITPDGWVHEQDNTKLVLSGGTARALVREVGINTYRRSEDFSIHIADDYWQKTAEYWAAVRGLWAELEESQDQFAITVKGETEAVYSPLMAIANDYGNGSLSLEAARKDARAVIERYTATDLVPLQARLRAPGEETHKGNSR